jgi:1-acyl-sn-glycerol-3-phosphate acyltransferase
LTPAGGPGEVRAAIAPGRRAVRGMVTFAVIGIHFLVTDLLMRIIVTPLVRLFPRRRVAVLSFWQQRVMLRPFMAIVRRMGGARLDVEPSLPCEPGLLIVSNHQSLLDIPILSAVFPEGYPLMVARERYGRGVPLISYAIRLYGHLLVRPGHGDPRQLETLREAAQSADRPLLIFPEGHRTRDGEMRPWKTSGLAVLLGARRWRVHAVVIDGLWQALSVPEFVREIPSVRARVVEAGAYDFDPATDDVDAFVTQLRERMCDTLHALRGAGANATESARRG